MKKAHTQKKAERYAEWEAVCDKCGLCCNEKVWNGSEYVLDLGTPCQFLGEDDLCTVYPRRFTECRACRRMTLFRALFARYLPPSCAYLKLFPRWRKIYPTQVVIKGRKN